MKTKFKMLRLGEVANISAGGDKPKCFSKVMTKECNIPVFANGETKEGLQGYTDKAKFNTPAVTVSARGTIGYTALRKDPFVPIVRLLTLIPNPEKIDVFYLYYYLNLYRQNGLGSSQAQLIVPDLAGRPISVPNLSIQKSIGKVLYALDQKINLNNKISTVLKKMAKTIFDYWFVQFDFPDKNGKPYKSSGGKMVFNEKLKREIPEGWGVGSLLEIADYLNGLPCQKYRPINDDALKVIKIKEMNEGFSEKTELVRLDIPEKLIIENGDILFSWSASLDVQIWSKGRGALNQHIFKVTSKHYPKSFYYYQLINYIQHFKMMAKSRKTTMGHITQDHLKQSRIVLPPKELTQKLDDIISPILKNKIINDVENYKLSELRDWLLPMLMNGQVQVK